ncbi:hypothetical protein L7F22_054417 [Adiantum nelumboides]|nr:hypothetical protein [Adiantum nelumboides]
MQRSLLTRSTELLPFELSLYFPPRPLLPAGHVAAGLPETPAPLKVAVTPQETLNDLRITITDSPEGYWLGAFCFRKKALKAPSSTATNGASTPAQLGDVVGEWVELKEVFEGVPRDQRELYIAHAEARAHVQRLRELLSGGQSDPSTIGIDGGLSVHDAIKNPELWEAEREAGKKVAPKSKETKPDSSTQEKTPFSEWAGAQEATNMASLVPPQARSERSFPQCLRHLSVAAWNPPPHHLRIQQGHLLYLHVVTLEGDTLFVTASSQGFYINRSTAARFDPSPRPGNESFASCSLFDVLCGVSPLFLANFAKLFQDPASQRDYFAVVPVSNCLSAHPWLARDHAHSADSLRNQAAYLLTGATSADALDGTRDWNDEIQSTRELPRSTLAERLMRDRVLNRVYAEFSLAAARAVPRVAAGEVQAMNPMDAPEAQMFIVNNLFISKGVDGVDIYPHMGGDEAAHVAVSKDVQGIRILNNLDVEGLCLLGTVVIDWKGQRWVAQTVVPGLFRRRDDEEEVEEEGKENKDTEDKEKEGEEKKVDGAEKKVDAKDDTQVIYGGVEGPEIIHDDTSFHNLFGRVARTLHLALHNVKDAKGDEHSLWLSVDSKGLRGADGRKYALDLARLHPVDIEWLENDMEGAVISGDSAELISSSEPKETYPHRMTLLRQELLEIHWDHEFRAWAREELASRQQGKKEGDKEEEEAPKLDASKFSLSFNPDAFVEFKAEDKPAVLVDDESDPSVAAVRKASKFIRETSIPRLVTDVATGLHTTQDGASLTRQLHARGISIRYLGHVARLCHPSQRGKLNQELLEKAGPGIEGFLKPFLTIVHHEMVVRAAKRILRSLVKNVEQTEVAACISHFLNCLLGSSVEPTPSAEYAPSPFAGADEVAPAWTKLTPEALKKDIESQIRRRYRYQLPRLYLETELRKPQLLRDVCQRCGIQLKLREYSFERVTLANGHASEDSQEEKPAEGATASAGGSNTASSKKKRKGKGSGVASAESRQRTTSFEPSDVLNLLPVIKDSTPKSTLAEEAFEAGRISMGRGDRALGVELMTEGVGFHEQVYGVVHPEVARCYAVFATILHHYASVIAVETAEKQRQAVAEGGKAEDVQLPEISEQVSVANALRYQRQAVTVSERSLGLDHPETLAQWVNLAVLERLEGNVDASLRCQQRVLDLWSIIYGADHPECVNALNNIALTLQNARRFDSSLKVYQAAHELALKLFGPDSINTAHLAHELSQALTLCGDLKKALSVEKEANRVFEARLGKDDNQTKESEALLSNLAASAVRVAKMEEAQKQREARGGGFGLGQLQSARGAAGTSAQRIAGATSARTGAAAAAATASTSIATPRPDMSDRSVDELVKFIQGGSGAGPGAGAASSANQSSSSSSGNKKKAKTGMKLKKRH